MSHEKIQLKEQKDTNDRHEQLNMEYALPGATHHLHCFSEKKRATFSEGKTLYLKLDIGYKLVHKSEQNQNKPRKFVFFYILHVILVHTACTAGYLTQRVVDVLSRRIFTFHHRLCSICHTNMAMVSK